MTLLTEKEAAEKWCPMFRVGAWNGQELFTNLDRASDDHRDVHIRCIGSKCMAWRWASPTDEGISGFCGAFGKVEG